LVTASYNPVRHKSNEQSICPSLECWIECHRDVENNWELIEEKARDLQKKKILSSEYFENFLLSRRQQNN